MSTGRNCLTAACVVLVVAFVVEIVWQPSGRAQAPSLPPEIIASGQIERDSFGIPHLSSATDVNLARLLGFVHAQDRLFQMDTFRRTFSGTFAEVFGQPALAGDIQLRTIGIRRAAEASLPAYSADTRALLAAYAEGVNAYLNSSGFVLPPEYGALELTRASIPAWTALDTVTIAKGIVFQLSFDQLELTLTPALAAYQEAGRVGNFDGTLLFFEDLFRSAPFDASGVVFGVPLADARGSVLRPRGPLADACGSMLPPNRDRQGAVSYSINPEALELARQHAAKLREIPILRHTVDPSAPRPASNWFMLSGRLTESGFPMIANDPHLALTAPPLFYEAELTVSNDPVRGRMHVAGLSFAGAPVIAQGCNDRICWGSTVNPLDVTDIYQERLVLTLGLIPRATIFDGREEPVVLLQQAFRVNRTGNQIADDLAAANVGLLEGGVTLLVPRRNNGPIVAVNTSNPQAVTALSVQYAGSGPTREIEAQLGFARARNIEDFRAALQSYDVGSQNWGYADVDGNIAYFTSAELPLREDLETLGRVDGTPPFLIRDGTHTFRNEWLPLRNRQPGQALEYEVLPFSEMPQVVNPAQGFIVNTNQDPAGVTLDNNPINQRRPSGGIYYLNPGYASGFRQGRLVGLLRDMQVKGEKMSLGIMAGIQANNQMLDAQIFTPYILAALRNARTPGAPAALAAFTADGPLAEAVDRLGRWDFSTPTGIREGWDPGDAVGRMPEPSHEDVQNSIAATLYSVWRGQVLRNTIDVTLGRLGLGSMLPPNDQSLAALRVLLERFGERRGRGASGVNFFDAPGAPTPESARDIVLLRSLRDALDLLAGDAFAPAFNRSRNQDDYRWGRLHRFVLSHPMSATYSVPPGGGFTHLDAGLPGISRAGGFETVDASTHSARAASANAFMFGSGSTRRFVAEMTPGGPRAFEVIPGGQSGNPASPQYASMLGLWLGNRFHPLGEFR